VKPYTALQLTGRDIYIREGCVGCHSQQVRPLVAEVMRYGPASKAPYHLSNSNLSTISFESTLFLYCYEHYGISKHKLIN
jgi:hypothetical protein